jgi:hypothetical protein
MNSIEITIPAEQVAKDKLKKLKVPAAGERDARDRDEGDCRRLGRNYGKRNCPPGYRAVAEKVVFGGLLFATEPGTKNNDAD